MSATLNKDDLQGGKKFGEIKSQQALSLDSINQMFLEDEDYQDTEDLAEKLESSKARFMEFDEDNSGDLDIMEVKLMMEKLGQAKTHLQLKKMIAEVDTTNSGTITYSEFLVMMLGKRSSVLKRILMFEDMMKEKDKPKGPPPKKTISDFM